MPPKTHPGVSKLVRHCAYMKSVRDLYGAPPPRLLEPGFPALLRIIVDQQVSTHAGAAIWRKLESNLKGKIEPKSIIRAGEDLLRGSGFSRGKTRYALGLSEAIVQGDLDLDGLVKLDDAAAQSELVKIKGIGRWTAEIYLMFSLGRPDIMPSGDLALQVAAGTLLGMDERPSIKDLDAIAERWRPYRSTAAVMLWHYYRHTKAGGGGEPARQYSRQRQS
ncbi:MAG: DNA-3-methyladenine glycosylase 2 family protein [Rhodospirillales bacterium]